MQKTPKKHITGFTLVELIIVITILAILATISFISFQNYTKDTRDSVRLTDIKQIYNGLDIKRIQTQTTPTPENGIEITNGTTILTKQGYAGKTILKQIKINNGGQDPLTEGYYTYTTDPQNKKIQLMTYLETSNKEVKILGKLEGIIKQANATTNSGYYQDKHIYIYGDKIGILTDKNKVPLQETTTNTGIDLTTNHQELKTYFGGEVYENGISTKTGTTLINQIEGVQNGTVPCNETNYNGYTITSLQDQETQTYTKTLTGIENGTGTGEIEATCNNGILNYTERPNTLNCTTGYVPNTEGTNCVENKCSGTFPDNAEENGTQELGSTWNYSESPGICKFKCQEGYTYDSGNNTCSINKYTISGTITNGNGGTINLCGTSTNIDSSGNFSLSNIDYGTNCSGITITKDSHNCSITTNGPSSLSGDVIDVNGSCSLQYLDIANSLRFNGTNQYLNKSVSIVGNRQKWTWSGWVKKTKSDTQQIVFEVGDTSSRPYAGISFNTDNTLQVFEFADPAEFTYRRVTTTKFTDVSWHHIIVLYDSSNVTANNRVKIIVDGIEATYDTGNDGYPKYVNPSQNFNSRFNSTYPHVLGKIYADGVNQALYNGYMSEINFIDGQALLPENFGVNIGGKRLPKSYTGTYGTNGFHLDFSNSGNLGDDVAGSNDWTLQNYSTPANDQMIDSPTNNFATINTSNSPINTTVSNGALNFYSANPYTFTTVQSSLSIPQTGKWYFETTRLSTGPDSYSICAGIQKINSSNYTNLNSRTGRGMSSYIGYYNDEWGFCYGEAGTKIKYNNNNQTMYGDYAGLNDTIGISWEPETGKLGYYKNGNYLGDAFIGIPLNNYSFAVMKGDFIQNINFGQGGQSSLNWCPNAGGYFKYCPPTGFKALSSKNIGN